MDKPLIEALDERVQRLERTKGGFFRETFRVVLAALTVAALLLVALVIAATACVRQAATRIHIDPNALSDTLAMQRSRQSGRAARK